MKQPKRIEVIARGLVVRDECVLVCEPVDGDYCYLPGGHVEPGEMATSALAREFREETGHEVRVGRLVAISEEHFIQREKLRHELNLVFHVELESPTDVASLEPEIRFRWVRREELAATNLLPRSAAGLAVFHVERDSIVWSASRGSVTGND